MDKQLWSISAERMKIKCEHQVPLSPQAMSVLAQLKPLSEHSLYVFPGRVKRSQPMHSDTVNKALWQMGYGGELVSHGILNYSGGWQRKFGYTSVDATTGGSESVGRYGGLTIWR